MNKEKELLKRFFLWGVIANAFIFVFFTISSIVFPKLFNIDYNIIKSIFYFYFSPIFFILTDVIFTSINKHDIMGLVASFLFYGSILISGYGFLSGFIGFKLYRNKIINNPQTSEKLNLYKFKQFLLIGIILSFVISLILFIINYNIIYIFRISIIFPIFIIILFIYTSKRYFDSNTHKIQENCGETRKRQIFYYSLVIMALNAAALFCPALFFISRDIRLPLEIIFVSVLGLLALLLYLEIKCFQGAGTMEEKKIFKLIIFSSAFCIIWNICMGLFFLKIFIK